MSFLSHIRAALAAALTLSVLGCLGDDGVRIVGTPAPNSDREEPGNVAAALSVRADGHVVAVRNDEQAWSSIGAGAATMLEVEGRVVAVSDDASTLLALTPSTALVVDVADRSVAARIPGGFRTGALSRDGDHVALVRSTGRTIAVYRDLDPGSPVLVRTERYEARNLAISDDAGVVVVGSGHHSSLHGHTAQVEAWRVDGGERTLATEPERGTHHGVWRVAVSGDGAIVAADTQVRGKSGVTVWDTGTGKPKMRIVGRESYWSRGIAISRDARLVGLGDEKGGLAVWNVATGKQVLEKNVGQVVNAVAFSPGAAEMGAALWDSTVGLVALPD